MKSSMSIGEVPGAWGGETSGTGRGRGSVLGAGEGWLALVGGDGWSL